MSPKQALAFVKKHGVVLQAAHGPVPSLAEAVAGERIRGSWWGHPKGKDIFHSANGAHRARRVAFPAWVPADVARQAENLPLAEARALLSPWPALAKSRRR